MPLTEKGKKIMKSMQKQYGKKKAEKIFYASKNAGKITGVEKTMKVKKANTGKLLEKQVDRYLQEKESGGKFSDLDRQRVLDMLRNRELKDPEPPKQKIEFDEAKKGKMMKASMGALIGFGADNLLKKSESARKLASNLGLSGMALSKYYSDKAESNQETEQKTAKAKKGKIMSRKSGSPKKGENVMMKEKQKLFKEIDQAQKSLKPKKLKGGGAAIRGMNFKGVF